MRGKNCVVLTFEARTSCRVNEHETHLYSAETKISEINVNLHTIYVANSYLTGYADRDTERGKDHYSYTAQTFVRSRGDYLCPRVKVLSM